MAATQVRAVEVEVEVHLPSQEEAEEYSSQEPTARLNLDLGEACPDQRLHLAEGRLVRLILGEVCQGQDLQCFEDLLAQQQAFLELNS